jgi:hypothetical protein
VYSYYDATGRMTERRFEIGSHEIEGPMMMDPWVHRDFADGRISHINGVPVHDPSVDYGKIMDHRPMARKALEQMVNDVRNRRPPSLLQRAAQPPEVVTSLNLAGSMNLIQDDT